VTVLEEGKLAKVQDTVFFPNTATENNMKEGGRNITVYWSTACLLRALP